MRVPGTNLGGALGARSPRAEGLRGARPNLGLAAGDARHPGHILQALRESGKARR